MTQDNGEKVRPVTPDLQAFEDQDLYEFRRLLACDIRQSLSRCSQEAYGVNEFLNSGRTLEDWDEGEFGPNDPLMGGIVYFGQLESSLWTMWRLIEEMKERRKKNPRAYIC